MKDTFPKDAIRPDPRTPEAKAKDHTHEKLYSGLPAVWLEKPQSTWFLPSQRNQSTSYSCLYQSAATAIESINRNVQSAIPYKLRSGGAGSQGDFLQNVGDVLYNTGTVLESDCPSENMSDPQIDATPLPSPMTVKATGYRTIGTITIEAVAEAVQAYGNCILIFSSNTQEWQLTPVYLGTPTTFGHAICATDFTTISGVKTLICRDSAGQFSSPTGVRLITENFLNSRCRGAMYLLGAKIVPPISPVDANASNTVGYWTKFFANLKAWYLGLPQPYPNIPLGSA